MMDISISLFWHDTSVSIAMTSVRILVLYILLFYVLWI